MLSYAMTRQQRKKWLPPAFVFFGIVAFLTIERFPETRATANATPASSNERTLRVGDDFLNGEIAIDSAFLKNDEYHVRLYDKAKAVLTLNAELQTRVEDALERAKAPEAAAVVMSLDGRILALTGRENGTEEKPSLALTSWAPAASIFKLVTTAALLQQGLSAKTTACYRGGWRGINKEHLTEPETDRLCDDLRGALGRSINSIYANLATQHLSANSLQQMAERLGFGKTTPFAVDWTAGWAEVPKEPLELCLLYTSPSPRDATLSRMPSSA